MKKIEDRRDVNNLVNRFYSKIRENGLLGPIFDDHIAENEWPAHLDKLTDFWETKIFGIPKFKGNPTAKHVNVDKHLKHTVEQRHFEEWLRLWVETIDEMFVGEHAEKAKNAARKMAAGQFLAVLHQRPKHF